MTAAYQVDGQPASRARFYALACDPQRSVVVEACAGAGKTWMLVSRILRALLAGTKPHEILAITFTRKAAGEMRQRLDDWLREFAAPGVSDAARTQALIDRGVPPAEAEELAPALAGLHEQVLRSGRAVEVRTFHAWFSQLLRAAPLALLAELGLQPDLDLIEDLDDHRSEIFRRFHAALLREPALQADHARLIAERGRSQAQRWFDAALAKRVEFELADEAGVLDGSVISAAQQWPELEGLEHPTEVLASAAWDASLRELAGLLARGGARAVEAADGIATALVACTPAARFEAIWPILFTQQGKPRKLGTQPQIAAMQDEFERIATQVQQHDAHLEHARMVRLVRVLLREFAAFKRARGLADMADLERCGLALLRDATLAGWVQERLDARIRHVLIDEFQDTSPLQWHALLAWLSAYAGAGGGASGQRPPGVFIVGDPKQSIYRFRRAEPKVFAAARDFVVGQLGGVLLACDHTRRNAPELLAGINTVFSEASLTGEFTGFRHHTTELESAVGAGIEMLPRVMRPQKTPLAAAPERIWRDSLTTPRHAPEEVLREQEAARVALAVEAAITTQGIAPAEIFVLSRKRQSLRLAAQALRQRHLPYAAVEDDALMAAPEARDLVAVLDALASPQHRLALAQALRSPLFAASDDDLIALAERAVAGDWWRALTAPAAPSADAPALSPALQRAGRLLLGWQAAARALPPHDLLDRIVAEGDLRERVAATVPPEQRAAAQATISAVLSLALTLDGARYATPYNFVRALKRRRLKGAAASQPDAVQLLTVHGAKGLEARLVFVMDADPELPGAETATLLVDWPVDAERPRRCAFVYAESMCPPSLRALLDAELVERRREELNGLYVAMSRAKTRLVFSATEPFRRAAGAASWWQRIEPLATLWQPQGAAIRRGSALPMPAVLMQLPAWADALSRAAPGAQGASPTDAELGSDAESIARSTTDAESIAGTSTDAASARLGRAVHRVLEWHTGPAAADADAAGLRLLADGAAREFGAPPERIWQLAKAIVESPACAPFFGGPALRWAGNEVPVNDAGDALRIDRLVELAHDAGSDWWVLDYKLQHAPAELPAYREQLRRYSTAVRRIVPTGSRVRAAFITGAGAVVELDDV